MTGVEIQQLDAMVGMEIHFSRLSALPRFLRAPEFWKGVLNPRERLQTNKPVEDLRIMASSHRWGIQGHPEIAEEPTSHQKEVVQIAQGLLERGVWTLPSWRIEQFLGAICEQSPGWSVKPVQDDSPDLRLEVTNQNPHPLFQHALVTARLQSEGDIDVAAIWDWVPSDLQGSNAERTLLELVIGPELGLPLMDFLALQPSTELLGLNPKEFGGQRPDFALYTARGHRLIIEVDGDQHLDPGQASLDRKRDAALQNVGWDVWRVPTKSLHDIPALRKELRVRIDRVPWGSDIPKDEIRPKQLLTLVWGATISARIQFLLLEAIRKGFLPWDGGWKICLLERDTEIGHECIEDFRDWFGRLRALHGETPLGSIEQVKPTDCPDLVVDISATQPYVPQFRNGRPTVWSRPANLKAGPPSRTFGGGGNGFVPTDPSSSALIGFVQDILRKRSFKEGQFEILSRILQGQDVVGLLPTGGGKSLTYQVAGLLLGGVTLYVSPLKSLLQDQRERLRELGIDQVEEISSALSTAQKVEAGKRLASGGVRFLLISPERFLIPGFREILARYRAMMGEVSLVVVDECHCVSEWGHEFRPAYLSLSRIVRDRTNRLGITAPIVALTGTASTIVLADVQRELGIQGRDAVIRAKSLERRELTLKVVCTSRNNKHIIMRSLLQTFHAEHPDQLDGLLVFTRFIGTKDGVLGISAELLANLPKDSGLRFFCGEMPSWKSFAKFRLHRKADSLTKEEVKASLPEWAAEVCSKEDWEATKSKVQTDFLSGQRDSFRTMVATNAFGMGIDKPSIRTVVHYLSPPSPEAYYQEVGRAGRDGAPSAGILLFSDEFSEVTDKILSPENSIEIARSIFETFQKEYPWKGGDFIQTFFFHQNNFLGKDEEVDKTLKVLYKIKRTVSRGEIPLLQYSPDTEQGLPASPDRMPEKELEYCLVRLIHLGVIFDYTKDYNTKSFDITVNSDWLDVFNDDIAYQKYLLSKYSDYISRYEVTDALWGIEKIQSADRPDTVEAECCRAMVEYVYESIERKRRQASRQMLELARKGATDPEGFRRDLMLYLQASERFTHNLEDLAQSPRPHDWKLLVTQTIGHDEIRELHGACQRVLESFPTHPGLLAISAVTRLAPTEDEIQRSIEDFNASLARWDEMFTRQEAINQGHLMCSLASRIDPGLAEPLRSSHGNWLLDRGHKDEATKYLLSRTIRIRWVRDISEDLLNLFPKPVGE